MATGDPILIGNANYGSVGFGDSTILSADAAGALESVLLVEPINQGSGNAIVGRSWSAGPAGGWAVAALGDQVWSDGLWTMGRTAILAQGNEFGAVVSGDDAVTASGRLSGVRASASGPDDFGQTAGVGVVSSGGLTGVDATGGTTGVAGRGPAVGVQGVLGGRDRRPGRLADGDRRGRAGCGRRGRGGERHRRPGHRHRRRRNRRLGRRGAGHRGRGPGRNPAARSTPAPRPVTRCTSPPAASAWRRGRSRRAA